VPPIAPITDANPTVEDMATRVARFAALRPTAAYVDDQLPGCERTTLPVLGKPPDAPLAAADFHLNFVQCAPGKAAPLHNHLTQEVFIALSGDWEVYWGPQGDRSLRLGAWDVISVPPGVSRGFRNVGSDDAWLIGIASGNDPGQINWPESVRMLARTVGVTLPGA
jgi:mannose-6-phosphate isomerase-like protein (cupin superfamily)